MGVLTFPVGSAVLGVVRSPGTVRQCLRDADGEKQLPWVLSSLFAFCSQWIPRALGNILALGDFHPAVISAQPESGLPEEVSFHSQ